MWLALRSPSVSDISVTYTTALEEKSGRHMPLFVIPEGTWTIV